MALENIMVPYKGQGLGGKDFSWSAALVIDMIMNKEIGIPPSSPPY